jgi:hypothetical protein
VTIQDTLWDPSAGSLSVSRRHPFGAAALPVDEATIRRFLAKCAPMDDEGHRWWLGAIDGRPDGRGGYGRFHAGLGGTTSIITNAHRHAWTLAHGAVPPDLVVRHRCDEHLCTAEEHLEIGTVADNAWDTVIRPCRPAGVDLRGSSGRSRAIRQAVLEVLRTRDSTPTSIGEAARTAMLLGDPKRDQPPLWEWTLDY